MKKLLYIRSDSNNCIDECLMVVDEGYDKNEVLNRAEESGIELPSIESVIDLDADVFVSLPATERPYIG